jgi:hypothetical protein
MARALRPFGLVGPKWGASATVYAGMACFSTCASFRLLVIILMPQNRMLLLVDRMLLLDQWTPR